MCVCLRLCKYVSNVHKACSVQPVFLHSSNTFPFSFLVIDCNWLKAHYMNLDYYEDTALFIAYKDTPLWRCLFSVPDTSLIWTLFNQMTSFVVWSDNGMFSTLVKYSAHCCSYICIYVFLSFFPFPSYFGLHMINSRFLENRYSICAVRSFNYWYFSVKL